MTYLEKLKIEHPVWFPILIQDYRECPEDYGYHTAKELCMCEKIDKKDLTNEICRRCWNQEITEKKS